MDTRAAGKLGGKARAKRLTKAQRSEAARKAITARWDKVKTDKAKRGKR